MAPGLLLGFLALLGLALFGDLRQVSGAVLRFRWVFFPLVLGLTLFNYALRFVKWHYYLSQIGAAGIPIPQSARLFVAGFPLAVTPGKVGEVLKGVWLKQISGVPVSRGVSVVVAERISDGLAVLVLSTAGVIAFPQYWPGFAFVLAVLLGLIVVSQIRPLALGLLRFGERLPLVRSFIHSLHEFYESSYMLFRPKSSFIAISLGSISWLGEGLGMYLILLGLGIPSGWRTLSIAVFVLSFSIVVGAVSALPGGLGAAEASIAGMFSVLLGMAPEQAAAATLLIRMATLWFGVSLGLAVWVVSADLLGLSTPPLEGASP